MEYLQGGRMTPGVVRIDDTVRRPASPGTAEVLRLLEARGFTGAPRYLGQDDEGRDVLSYLEGWVPARFQIWSDEQVAAIGALLRRFHDATRGSALTGRYDVICHHDPGPNNTVFRGELPVALIDFDTAAPGSVLEDLGYVGWTWCVASKYGDPERQAKQIRVLADGYGVETAWRGAIVDAVIEQQARNVRFWTEQPRDARELIEWSRRELAFTVTHRDVFDQQLSGA
jgi:hypothetical protein